MSTLLRDRAAASVAMLEIFSDRALLDAAMRFESALAGALAAAGLIPADAATRLRALCASPGIEIEALATAAAHAGTLAIPLVAHLRALAGDDAGFVHLGSTSQDLADTALMLQASAGIDLIARDLARLSDALAAHARRHDGQLMTGRTLLQAALPVTFGLKAAQWMCGLDQALARLRREACCALAVQFGGAAGTRAGLAGHGAAIAATIAVELGLASPALPWHGRRDGIAGLAVSLAIVVGAVGKVARDIALLAQGEVAEAFEPRTPGRGGSSALAHKRNPTGCQVALSAAVRAPGLAAGIMGGMSQEHERGLGGWQAEAPILADLFCLAHGAIAAMLPVIEGLEVDPARMQANLAAAGVGVDAGESEALVAAALYRREHIEVRTDDGAVLRARLVGPTDAPPLLLLHSLGCDGTLWTPQIRALSQDFRMIVPDLRGHGDTCAPSAPVTLGRLGRDALVILDHARVRRAHVCGISLGGAIAQWLAIEAPERVDRLVLANTAARIGSHVAWQEREALVRTQGMAAVAPAVIGRFFGPDFRKAHPDVASEFLRRLVSMPADGYAACCAALRDADLTARLGAIASPTLVIGGSHDESTPPALAEALAAGIAGARLLIIDAAHLSNLECPAVFNDALREHLLEHL
ncbi:3-carboxy-cis,cis-muconate cycloisomerase [Lichenicoccus sp.]|uniref:3-carboxy-cis,cis-muconate cycloisomerase n=1 Tax=Lichenicoccus sp. TaxID=2781899 RepID=UPI003D0F117C